MPNNHFAIMVGDLAIRGLGWISVGLIVGIFQGCETPYSLQEREALALYASPALESSVTPSGANPGGVPQDIADGLDDDLAYDDAERPIDDTPADDPAKFGRILVKLQSIRVLYVDHESVSVPRPGEIVDLALVKDDVIKQLRLQPIATKPIRAIRLITQESGHQVLGETGQDLCGPDVKVPGGTRSGLKIQIGGSGFDFYRGAILKLQFSPLLPVVFHGGGCNIHPSYQSL